MVAVKEETGSFRTKTSFGGRKRFVPDAKWKRPVTRGEAIRQVEKIYFLNDWDETEQSHNATMLGLKYKRAREYTNEELRTLLDDFEFHKMIHYEK